MKDILTKRVALSSSLALAMLLAGAAMLYADQMTGWVTDKPCAQSGHFTGAEHKQHVAQGNPAVFVNERDKKVYAVANQEKVTSMAGEKVTITATVRTDGSLEVESIGTAPSTGAN